MKRSSQSTADMTAPSDTSCPARRAGKVKPPRHSARLLDLVETVVLLLLFGGQAAAGWLAPIRTLPRLGSGLLLVSECVALALFLSRRRATARATSPVDWLVAWSAVGLPLLLRPSLQPVRPVVAVLALVARLAGFVVQLHAKCALGRNLGIVPALRTVCVRGPYRYVRHPMYAGYALSQVGFLALHPTGANGVILAVAWLVQWLRLRREELVLAGDEDYAAYVRRVPYRLVPGWL